MADEKKYLRHILSECRNALPDNLVRAASAAIQSKLLACEVYQQVSAVVLYAAIDNEVLTGAVADAVFASQRPLLYPRLDRACDRLELVKASSLADLSPGAFEIPEPRGADVVEPDSLDRALVCVPGLAFTPAGERLGRGGGHYDRLLALIDSHSVKIGLAYSFQLLDSIAQIGSDERLDLVVTEYAIHECRGSGEPRPVAMAEGGSSRWR